MDIPSKLTLNNLIHAQAGNLRLQCERVREGVKRLLEMVTPRLNNVGSIQAGQVKLCRRRVPPVFPETVG